MNKHVTPPAEPTLTAINSLSCSRTLRNIAVSYAREAKDHELSGNHRFYVECRDESRKYWQRAWWWFNNARLELNR